MDTAAPEGDIRHVLAEVHRGHQEMCHLKNFEDQVFTWSSISTQRDGRAARDISSYFPSTGHVISTDVVVWLAALWRETRLAVGLVFWIEA
jgi:hypothetical protein